MLKKVTLIACTHPMTSGHQPTLELVRLEPVTEGKGIGDRLIKKGKEKNRREKMERNSQEGVK